MTLKSTSMLLTREDPEYIPEAECLDRPINKWSFDFALKADSAERVPSAGSYRRKSEITGLPRARPVCLGALC
jgi:hypothetical protein